MSIPLLILFFSSFSFFFFGLSILVMPRMREEFERYGVGKMRKLTGCLELAGAVGLLAGLREPVVGALAAGGLCLLMMLGFLLRLKIGDGWLRALPALVYALMNLYLLVVLAQSARA